LWLGLMVLFIGDRRSKVTWVGGLGLLLGALFFLTHGALVGGGVPTSASPADFWWRLSWVPAFTAPLFWAATGLHYAGLAGAWRRLRLPALLAVTALGALTVLLALLSWPAIAHYGDFIRLVDRSLRTRTSTAASPSLAAPTPALPGLGLAFVVYIAACACLPWASLVARRLLPTTEGRSAASGADAALLWNARDAWSRARPALLAASIFMMGAGAVVALIGILISLAKRHPLSRATTTGLPVAPSATASGHVPLGLVIADLAVQVALAGVGLAVGWAVVRQGVLVERRLPQRGSLSHWRGMAIVAGIFAAVVAAMAAIQPEALPELLVLVALVAGACAVVTWQSYVAHDKLLAQLRPFVASLAVGHAGWLTTDPAEIERNVSALFTSLCRDVLGAARGRLSLTAGRLHRTFTYEAPAEVETDPHDLREWALPVSDERGVVARLVLGPRADGAGYTSADLEVARACGQRILDAVGEFAAAQAIASLARRRGLEAELSAALPRRVLHDDVLPRLHLAMLKLESLRAGVLAPAPVPAKAEPRAVHIPPTDLSPPETPSGQALHADLGGVVMELGRAHHDLAALMRAMPLANQRRLEHGLVSALRAALDGEFRGTFDALEWETSAAAGAAADALPAIAADLLLGATLEAVRNAGRHARGGDLHRRLGLRVALSADARWVTVAVADDGVGLHSEGMSPTDAPPDAPAATVGTRSGLLTHGALLGLVGGALAVHDQSPSGTLVALRVPRGESGAMPSERVLAPPESAPPESAPPESAPPESAPPSERALSLG
ncbi:MAG: hypothetical protein IVW57_12455, partial [Ktedonobacterales bacterium]|nr:hypothetical protein [Ktedonobacterales bacterium]